MIRLELKKKSVGFQLEFIQGAPQIISFAMKKRYVVDIVKSPTLMQLASASSINVAMEI